MRPHERTGRTRIEALEHTTLRTRTKAAHTRALVIGPYLSERAWGTVREDYSPDGNAWNYFTYEHARSRAYRWSEDGFS